MKKFSVKQLMLNSITMGLLISITSTFVPVYSVSAQEGCPFLILNAEPDTETSIYPQVRFEVKDGNHIAEQIVIDDSSLFADKGVVAKNVVLDKTFTSEYVDLKNYRDYITFPRYYIVSDNSSLEVISPTVTGNKAEKFFTPLQLLDAQFQDISYKSSTAHLGHYSQDPYEIYAMSKVLPVSFIADAKGDVMRAEIHYAKIPNADIDYIEATSLMGEIYHYYNALTGRYHNACSDNPTVSVKVSENLEMNDNIQHSIDVINATIPTLPLDVRQRLYEIHIVPESEMANLVDGYEIEGYATTDHLIRFSDDYHLEPAIVYHEVGHIVDFSSTYYHDATLENGVGFSNTPEWLSVHNEEWNVEGSYYSVPIESFAQGFAAYMTERVHGVQLSDYGYEDNDIADRPRTRAYFDALFERLGFNQ